MIQKAAYIKFVVLFLLMTGLYGCTDHSNEPANATENPTTTQDETTSEYTEETTELPEGVAYIMEDGSSVLIDSLLKPVQTYNRICLTADAYCFCQSLVSLSKRFLYAFSVPFQTFRH